MRTMRVMNLSCDIIRVREQGGVNYDSIMKETTAVGLVVALLYFSQRVTAGGTLNLTLKLTARMLLTMESCFAASCIQLSLYIS